MCKALVLMSVCFFFSVLCVLLQEEFFLNVLLLFEFLMMVLFVLCMYGGLLKASAVFGFTCIMVLCLEVASSVMGLALVVNSSRHSGKKKVNSFSFLSF